MPYDAGFLLVRDGEQHRRTFAAPAAYLRRETRGLAAGSPWPCDYGPDLSRGFRALKTWFTLKTFGTEKLGAMISRTCDLAQYWKRKLPPSRGSNCLRRYNSTSSASATGPTMPTASMRDIVATLHESGISAPSTTILDGRLAIRAAIVNHRTDMQDIDALLSAVLEFGAREAAVLTSIS